MASDKQDKVLNVPTKGKFPNLRFPEFTDDWEQHPTTDYFEFKNGLNPDAKRFGSGTKFISVMDILNNRYITYDKIIASVKPKENDMKEFGVNYGDILFQRSSETLEDVGRANVYLDKGTALFGGFVIRGKKIGEYNPLFFRYLLSSPHVRKRIVVKGAGAQHFNIGQDGLSKVALFVPSAKEQEQIANLLNLVDERIETQIRIIEDLRNLKTYIHNRVFSKANKLFGQRNTIRLSDIATKITRKNKGNTINNVLSNSAAMGIVPQAEVFDKEIANEDNTANYYVIGNGDFVYNPRKSAQAPFGPINMYKGQAKGIISPLYLCFQVTDINKNYLLHYFMSNVWYSYIYSNGDTGVRHDRVSIKDETFLNMSLYIHTIDKQKEIAKMMDQVDAKIALEELYLTKLQKQKDYLLAAMFV